MADVNMGMDAREREISAEVLKQSLADTYVLYLKTQNFHWNVTGPLFPQLHSLFESQYEALAEAVDELAERIRALGLQTPASFSEYLELSTLQEAKTVPSAEAMIAELLDDNETIVRTMRDAFDALDEVGDEITMDMFIERMTYHEKTAWMLRACLD